MSNASDDVEETVETILQLANSSKIDDHITACTNHLCVNFFPEEYGSLIHGINKNVIPRFLPFILKCTEANTPLLQQEGAYFLDAIVSTDDEEEHTKLVIDAGAIPKLIKNLSSRYTKVLDQTLVCLGKIANHNPREIIANQILSSLNKCLKSTNQLIYFQAVKCFAILSTKYEEEIPDILGVNNMEELFDALESDVSDTGLEARYSLVDLFSSASNDYDALKSLKDIFEWLPTEKTKGKQYAALSDKQKIIKLLAIRLIKDAASNGDDGIDVIISEKFYLSILEQIKNGKTPEIKIEAIKVIESIIIQKSDFLPVIISEHNIISLLYSKLGSNFNDLLIISLNVLKLVAEMVEDKEDCRRKFEECGNLDKLEEYCEYANIDISEPAEFIFNFVTDDGVACDGRDDVETETIQNDDDDDFQAAASTERLRTRQQESRKRVAKPPASERSSTRSKRGKNSLARVDTEHSTGSNNNDDDDRFYDFDDHQGLYSPVSLTMPTTDGNDRNNLNARQPSQSANHSPTRPSFHGSPDSPEPASTGDEDFKFEIKYTPTPPPPSTSSPPIVLHGQYLLQSSSSQSHSTIPAATAAAAIIHAPTQNSLNAEALSCSANLSPTRPYSSNVIPALPVFPSSNNGLTSTETAAATVSPNDNPSNSASHMPPTLMESAPTGVETAARNNSARQTSTRSSEVAAAETSQSNKDPVKKSSPPDNSDTSSSRASSNNSPDLSALTSTGQFASSNQITPPASNNTLPNANNFPIVEYCPPYENTLKEYCSLLAIQFNQTAYYEFIGKIEFRQIRPNSQPVDYHPTSDRSGAGCFSVFFTGDERSADLIRVKIDAKFSDDLRQSGDDREKFDRITEVWQAAIMLPEHFETIAAWFSCRIMIYSDGKWEQYGDFDANDSPLFVLKKNEIKGKYNYQIVLELKDVYMFLGYTIFFVTF